jgi:serine/threonine-protein kinase
MTEVPPVVDESAEQATSELQAAGFSVEFAPALDSDKPANTVVEQDPSGGTPAASGTTVTIYVSQGPKSTTVPKVTSTDRESAKQTLSAAGFKVDIKCQYVSDPSQEGIVLSQDPAGGTSASAGAVVTLIIGIAPTATCKK